MHIKHFIAVCVLTMMEVTGAFANHRECRLFNITIPAKTVHCTGEVTISGCYGGCLSYQTFMLEPPHLRTHHPTCNVDIDTLQQFSVVLTDCADGYEPEEFNAYTATTCICSKCDPLKSICL